MEIINTNKRLCEPYGEAVDNAFVLFQENARGLDTFGEQENDDIRERPEEISNNCLLYTSPSPRDQRGSRMPSSA